MKDCERCIHKTLCYANCDIMYDRYEDTCFYCQAVSCPKQSECEYYEEKEGVVGTIHVDLSKPEEEFFKCTVEPDFFKCVCGPEAKTTVTFAIVEND